VDIFRIRGFFRCGQKTLWCVRTDRGEGKLSQCGHFTDKEGQSFAILCVRLSSTDFVTQTSNAVRLLRWNECNVQFVTAKYVLYVFFISFFYREPSIKDVRTQGEGREFIQCGHFVDKGSFVRTSFMDGP